MNCIDALAKPMAVIALVLSVACSTTPPQPAGSQWTTVNPAVKPTPIPEAAARDYERALAFMEGEDWTNAQSLLRQLQSQYPQLLSLTVALGWAYWQDGQRDPAVQQLQNAVATQQLYRSDAYHYLAIIYRQEGEFDRAEALYREALAIWTGDKNLYVNLGILYELYLHRTADALASYQQAQLIDPDDKILQRWVKDLQRRVAREESP